LEKISSVFGGHLKSINFSPRKWEGYYAYSSRVGGELCLLLIRPTIEEGVGIISLPQLRLVMCESLVHDEVALCFMIGKSHGWGTFPKCTWLSPHPRLLILRMNAPILRLYLTHK
jgi:hypothetical protein